MLIIVCRKRRLFVEKCLKEFYGNKFKKRYLSILSKNKNVVFLISLLALILLVTFYYLGAKNTKKPTQVTIDAGIIDLSQ